MSEYKISKGPRGRVLYFKREEGQGFRMTKRDNIPEHILATMEPEKPVDDKAPEYRRCIMCGQLGTERRFLNQQMVDLCLDDYQSRTTGEVVEKMRENQHEKVT